MLSCSEPKELNPREFTRVCALGLYLFGLSFVSFGVVVLALEPNPREFTGVCVLEALWRFVFC